MTNTLEAPILAINMSATHREDFESAQLQLAECIRMAADHSRHTNMNVSETSTGHGGRGGRGGGGQGGRKGGGRGDATKLPNKSLDTRGIVSGNFDYEVNKLSHINKNYCYPTKYANLSPLEKRKFYFNQQAQKSEPEWNGKSTVHTFATVSVAPTEVSALTLSIAS